tara:strand:+ start:1069 stop:1308 length:240 start_codon:yes stop_codon:yes gene_type:complete
MSNLKKEISKNIQLVFDREQLFIEEFALSDQIGMVYSFFMGSDHHKVCFEYSNGGFIDRTISANDFDDWKAKLVNANKE